MVMLPPNQRAKRNKLLLELAYIKFKEKIFGKLSEADKKRLKEIMRDLSIQF